MVLKHEAFFVGGLASMGKLSGNGAVSVHDYILIEYAVVGERDLLQMRRSRNFMPMTSITTATARAHR
jgi:hypothetical protein